MDGTSMTILLSENEDAGRWIWYFYHEPGCFYPVALCSSSLIWPVVGVYFGFPNNEHLDGVERFVGFCFPSLLGDLPEEIPDYGHVALGQAYPPFFINEKRPSSGFSASESDRRLHRTARPSSAHPGGVVAVFCDGHTQFLRENMDKTLFVRLARPGNYVILNLKNLD
jgi:prepilin-type processing-associated H-X9-DG protein